MFVYLCELMRKYEIRPYNGRLHTVTSSAIQNVEDIIILDFIRNP